MGSASAASSIPSTPSVSSQALDSDEDEEGTPSPSGEAGTSQSAITRTLQIPLVNSAIKVYEQGKERSRVVQYASSFMQTSLSAVGSRVPTGVTTGAVAVDEMVGRGWERLDRYRRPSSSSTVHPLRRDSDASMASDSEHDDVFVPSPPQSHTDSDAELQPGNETALQQRSRFHSLFLEAGGISAALSEESMRRLRYVLGWLMVCLLFLTECAMGINQM